MPASVFCARAHVCVYIYVCVHAYVYVSITGRRFGAPAAAMQPPVAPGSNISSHYSLPLSWFGVLDRVPGEEPLTVLGYLDN